MIVNPIKKGEVAANDEVAPRAPFFQQAIANIVTKTNQLIIKKPLIIAFNFQDINCEKMIVENAVHAPRIKNTATNFGKYILSWRILIPRRTTLRKANGNHIIVWPTMVK